MRHFANIVANAASSARSFRVDLNALVHLETDLHCTVILQPPSPIASEEHTKAEQCPQLSMEDRLCMREMYETFHSLCVPCHRVLKVIDCGFI